MNFLCHAKVELLVTQFTASNDKTYFYLWKWCIANWVIWASIKQYNGFIHAWNRVNICGSSRTRVNHVKSEWHLITKKYNCKRKTDDTSENYLIILESILPCKTKRQYLLTLQVSRYCLLALQSSIKETHCPASWPIVNTCRYVEM